MILKDMDRTDALKRIGEAVGMTYHPDDCDVWENVSFTFKNRARFSIWYQRDVFCARMIIPNEHHAITMKHNIFVYRLCISVK